MLPDEILNKEFSRAFKGYDMNEVEEYIETLIGMYEQTANENKELSLRCEQLSASLEQNREKVEAAEGLCAERDSIIARAETEAQALAADAREKAQGMLASAEDTARRLLTEAKARTDAMTRELSERQTEAEQKAEQTLADAMEEAKKLIKATKLNCVKRLDECTEKVAEARSEYDALVAKAADFRAMLFSAYSAQILAIEGLEIPERSADPVTETDAETDAETDMKTDVETEEPGHESEQAVQSESTAEQTSPSSVDTIATEQPEPTATEPEHGEDVRTDNIPAAFTPPVTDIGSVILGIDGLDTDTENEPEHIEPENTDAPAKRIIPATEKKAKKEKEERYAGFDVEKEHSGQVMYDSTNIVSVNKKLDDIMTKKGKQENDSAGVSRKLGFLK